MDGEIKYGLVRRVGGTGRNRHQLVTHVYIFDTKAEAEKEVGERGWAIVEVRPVETTVVTRKWPE